MFRERLGSFGRFSSVFCGGLSTAEILILSLTLAEVSLRLCLRSFPQRFVEKDCHLWRRLVDPRRFGGVGWTQGKGPRPRPFELLRKLN